jgi:DNA-binding transcriptional regulator GbsR (MarR family)
MAEDLDPKETVIEAMEDVAEVYGFRKSYARIYGTLYFKTEAATMDEISEETDFAKSTVSDAMHKLEELHLAHSEKREGHGKTKFYTPEEDLEEAMKRFMDDQATNEIQIMLDALNEAEKQAEEGSVEEEKIKNLKNFYQKSKKMIGVFKKLPSGKTFSKITESLKNSLTNDK